MEKKANIFICGASGTGKSTSMRNLDPERTIILNTERKQLPFRGALKFNMNQYIEDWAAFFKTFNKALESDKADVIVIESFTSLVEMIYKKSNDTFQGFDVWNDYKTKVGDILSMSKNTNKYVIFIGIDMTIDGANGVEERCVAVDGSWKKKVEKEFVIVCYSHMYTDENGNPQYEFITNKQDGFENISAKSPMEMLPLKMENDLKVLIEKIENYYKGE